MNFISILDDLSKYTDGRIISFDIASILVISVLLALSIAEKNYKTSSEKTFLTFIIASLLSSIFDVLSVLKNVPVPAQYAFNELYFLIRNIIPLIYIYYCLRIIGLNGKINKYKLITSILIIPYIILFILVVTSPWTKFIFFISKEGLYQRGPGVYILYGIAALYLLTSLMILIKYHNFFRKGYFLSLLSIYPFVFAGVIVQMINNDVLIECLATSLALVPPYGRTNKYRFLSESKSKFDAKHFTESPNIKPKITTNAKTNEKLFFKPLFTFFLLFIVI